MAILLVEQYLDFCRELADHVYIMDRGEIVHEGPAETLDTQDAAGTSPFDRASHAHSHDLCSSRECRQPVALFSAAPAAPMAEAQRIGRPQRAWGRGRLVAKPLAGADAAAGVLSGRLCQDPPAGDVRRRWRPC